MTKKSINNIQILKNLRDSKVGKVPASIQSKINKLTDLYEESSTINRTKSYQQHFNRQCQEKDTKALEKYDKSN